MSLNKRISKSNNKIKTTWNILNELLGKQKSMQGIQKLTIDGWYASAIVLDKEILYIGRTTNSEVVKYTKRIYIIKSQQ